MEHGAWKVTNMNPKLRHRATVLKHIFPECYQEVVGYWVWGPLQVRGAWTSWDLRVIAELLDEANRKWDQQITEYFEREDRS